MEDTLNFTIDLIRPFQWLPAMIFLPKITRKKDKNEYKWLMKHECYKALKYNIATACVILETKCKNVNKTMWPMLIILYKLLYANFQESIH